MKTELKAKFLQHLLSKKKANEGFTLVELLVVVIIIGILAAIALPSMLSQASKARLSGAQTAVGAVNRAQQAYRLENTTFATALTSLEIGTPAAQAYTFAGPSSSGTSTQFNGVPDDTSTDRGVSGCVTASGGLTSSTIKSATAPGGAPGC
ncbi:type IV pilin-like G/H family protein [Thermosynechococcaceae cyanobacterium BACA0444]|uniref:Type IV pilin-like G/H family protein n=1 Tax=Pseudocalidococcus azoricus BACA0444 TaxID=2918990 RepID=A0AAE4JW99_9CYAN|nr:type IV pilin-like G/H family protein [Pseudocalidococcus azoricus]MDS3860846.1 type IV pilin-like G/H family protein [Pseudocalidococcus azoricus BACA0444]